MARNRYGVGDFLALAFGGGALGLGFAKWRKRFAASTWPGGGKIADRLIDMVMSVAAGIRACWSTVICAGMSPC